MKFALFTLIGSKCLSTKHIIRICSFNMRFNEGIHLKQPTNIEIGEGVVSSPFSSRSCPCFRCIWPFCPKGLTRLDRARHNRCLSWKTWSCCVRFPVEMIFSWMFIDYSFCRWQMFFVLMSLSFSIHMCICFFDIFSIKLLAVSTQLCCKGDKGGLSVGQSVRVP